MSDYVTFCCPASLSFASLIEDAFKARWKTLSAIPVSTYHTDFKQLTYRPDCRGFVIPVSNQKFLEMVAELRTPLINISERFDPVAVAVNVRYDNEEVASLAATHLLQVGHTRFFFLEEPETSFSGARKQGFVNALRRRGHRVEASFSFAPNNSMNPVTARNLDVDQVRDWMAQIGHTGAVLAANDGVAVRFLRAVRICQPEMADTIGLVGVDDAYSRLSVPSEGEPITSILPNFPGAGQAAASALASAIMGEGFRPGSIVLVDGARLIERQTTGGVVCSDLLLTRITRWINGEVIRGRAPATTEVLRRFPMSERTLRDKFQRAYGESMREFTMKRRLQRAARLLLDTDSNVSEVAQRCGFNKHADLTERFKQHFGTPPSDFRAENKARKVT